MRSWYSLKVRDDAVDLYIYDEIGFFGISSSRLANELQRVTGKPLNVFINSPGGDVFDSVAIYNALVRHDGEVNVTVDGLAASGASVIAQAGNTRTMATGASMMIHDAWGIAMGDKATMEKMAEELDKISGSVADIYAERTDKSAEEWREQMRAETWYNADEAKEAGLADAVAPATQNAYAGRIFNLSKFNAVPEWVPQENEPIEPAEPVQTSPEGQEDTMDEKAIRQALGLDDEGDVLAAINTLNARSQDIATGEKGVENQLRRENQELRRDNQGLQQQVLSQESEYGQRILALEDRNRQKEAEWAVDLAINQGRVAPKDRDLALKLAYSDRDGFEKFAANLRVDLNERGMAMDAQMAELEPTAEEVKIAASMGVTREQLIAQKAADKGIKVPS